MNHEHRGQVFAWMSSIALSSAVFGGAFLALKSLPNWSYSTSLAAKRLIDSGPDAHVEAKTTANEHTETPPQEPARPTTHETAKESPPDSNDETAHDSAHRDTHDKTIHDTAHETPHEKPQLEHSTPAQHSSPKASSKNSVCEHGEFQSPIAISTNSSRTADIASDIKFHYRDDSFTFSNTNSKLLATPSSHHEVMIQGQRYTLVDIQFHGPSAHTLDQKQYPLELNLVHQDEKGNHAVLAVLVESGRENTILAQLKHKFPTPKHSATVSASLNPLWLVPQRATYFRYDGSQLAEPCDEGVAWHVFRYPIAASQDQIDEIKAAIASKSRATQKLFGRIPLLNQIDDVQSSH
jgi:carbonic anhydrase